MKLVSLVVPVYNEEEMLPIFFKKIEELFHDDDNYHYEFLLINDGSKDKTLDIIKEEAQKNDRLSYISFSRNYSQECAVEAGLRSAKGDVVIPLDCDFQDPPEVVFDMLKKYEEGYEVVNGKRSNRDDDTAMKKTTAGLFYKLTNKVAGKKVIEENVCFYRLMSRRVVDYINSLPEASRILRSQVPYIGFKTCDVFFARKKREAGKTKYNYSKLMGVAAKTFAASTANLLSFPFKISIGVGLFSFLGTFVFLLCYYCDRIHSFYYLPILILMIVLLATAILMLVFSIHSLYLKNIYENVQNRPRYFIEEYHVADKINK